MTAAQRREQLLDVSRQLFGEKGFEGTSVEEIAARAGVSKPVVYEHFGGKEGVYAVVVDREIQALTGALTQALEAGGHPQILVERTALALLDYIESSTDGFRILVRDSPVTQSTGTFSSLIGDVAMQVEHLLADQFTRRGLDPRTAPIYAQMLVGMVALTGQYWLDERKPKKAEVAAHLVNLAWNGLSGLQRKPDPARHGGQVTDEVDRILEAWRRERPDLDVMPLAVLSRISRMARHLDLARAGAFSQHGLEQWEFDVLSALRRAGEPYELSPGVLVAQTLVTSGTMTNRVDRLEARGLVERRPAPADRRGVLVRLTAAGRSAVDAAMADLIDVEHTLLADLGPADRARLADLLRVLVAPFDA